jgi:Tol biopolymer transport system component
VSPDGRSLAFIARRDGAADLRRKGLRATEPETVLTDSADEDIPESWSRDGRTLLFVRMPAANAKSIWVLSLDGGGEAELVLDSGFNLDEPHLSPDGRWLAYLSTESGRAEVYVEPFRRDGDRVRVSVDGGGQPKWRGTEGVRRRRETRAGFRPSRPPPGRPPEGTLPDRGIGTELRRFTP